MSLFMKINSLLLFLCMFQSASPNRSLEITGVLIRYDLGNNGIQADIIFKPSDSLDLYFRLIYNPHKGFDAPPLKPEEVLPKNMFLDANLVWAFRVHAPSDENELIACKSDPMRFRQDKDGKYVPIDRYQSLSGYESEELPKIENLNCYIVDAWKSAR
jgi:hypothetical protein